jgi:23S rRNA (cytidine1920-2'-O)/16S rRNA (cytidine1409-2'-O)-methyltransferase
MKKRADKFLVEHGYFKTRSRAQAAIAAGRVMVDGAVLTRASQMVAPEAVITAEPAHPYVSRAALKLIAGLDAFAIDPEGLVCLDIGASTGGFSQVLLERGAASVAAVDVGHGQLHPDMKSDPRLLSLEGVDARNLSLEQIGAPPRLIVCDASFISLEKVLPRPLSLAAPGAALIVLFKPQFEVGRAHIGKGGVVRDAAAVERAKEKTRAFLARAGFDVFAEIASPVPGGDGNREHLMGAYRT